MSFQTPNAFQKLYAHQRSLSVRHFKARGVSVVRCEHCQLSRRVCICSYTPKMHIQSEFVLLMHHDEIFKPTNTGRLIADAFPNQTHAYRWSRTQPDETLLALLKDKTRRCYILYPDEAIARPDNERNKKDDLTTHATTGNSEDAKVRPIDRSPAHRICFTNVVNDEKRSTFILLDGTWKQSARMLRLSRWLDGVAHLLIPSKLATAQNGRYLIRKAPALGQLATAQAAQLCLTMAGETRAAQTLEHYFTVFNLHYVATRMNTSPEIGDAHGSLLAQPKELR